MPVYLHYTKLANLSSILKEGVISPNFAMEKSLTIKRNFDYTTMFFIYPEEYKKYVCVFDNTKNKKFEEILETHTYGNILLVINPDGLNVRVPEESLLNHCFSTELLVRDQIKAEMILAIRLPHPRVLEKVPREYLQEINSLTKTNSIQLYFDLDN